MFGFIFPRIILNKVVFPDPESPVKRIFSPALISKSGNLIILPLENLIERLLVDRLTGDFKFINWVILEVAFSISVIS